MTVYTLQEAAEIVKMSPRTLRLYIQQGKLKAVKLSNYWRITEESLRELMETGAKNDGNILDE